MVLKHTVTASNGKTLLPSFMEAVGSFINAYTDKLLIYLPDSYKVSPDKYLLKVMVYGGDDDLKVKVGKMLKGFTYVTYDRGIPVDFEYWGSVLATYLDDKRVYEDSKVFRIDWQHPFYMANPAVLQAFNTYFNGDKDRTERLLAKVLSKNNIYPIKYIDVKAVCRLDDYGFYMEIGKDVFASPIIFRQRADDEYPCSDKDLVDFISRELSPFGYRVDSWQNVNE